MNHSENLDQFAPAFVAFQREVTGVGKNSTNSNFDSRYADLATIWETIREPLTRHGLGVIQLPGPVQNGVKATVSTMILHTSGQFIRHEGTFPIDAQNVHAPGSGVTFLKRYALQAALGLPSLDDDGNTAAGKPIHSFAESPKPAAPPKPPKEVHPLDYMTLEEWEGFCDERLIPAVRSEAWAATYITQGSNAGKLLGELDDDSMKGYEKIFCPPYLDAAVKDWRAWRDKQGKKAKYKDGPMPSGRKTNKPQVVPEESATPDDGPPWDEASQPQAKDGQPAPVPDFRETKIHFGKNAGLALSELSAAQLHWYETEWMSKKEVNGPASTEDIDLIRALKDYAAWSDGTYPPPLPMEEWKPAPQNANAEALKSAPTFPLALRPPERPPRLKKHHPLPLRPRSRRGPLTGPSPRKAGRIGATVSSRLVRARRTEGTRGCR